MPWLFLAKQLIDRYLASDLNDTEKETLLNTTVWEAISENASYTKGYSITASGAATNWVVSPDPVEDKTFIRLIVLRAACGQFQKVLLQAAKNAVSIANGNSSVQKQSAAQALQDLATKNIDPCSEYQDALASLGQTTIGIYTSLGADRRYDE